MNTVCARIAVLLTCLSFFGCSSTGTPTTAEGKAQRIAEVLKEAESVRGRIQDETRMAQREQRPMNVDFAIKLLRGVEDDLREAVSLSEDSFRPRSKLSEILHQVGLMYGIKRDEARQKVDALEKAGKPVPKELAASLADSQHWMRQYFTESNTELLFLKRYMLTKDPKGISFGIVSNHTYLEEWGQAATVLRDFLTNFRGYLTPEEGEYYTEQVRRLEERELKAIDSRQ